MSESNFGEASNASRAHKTAAAIARLLADDIMGWRLHHTAQGLDYDLLPKEIVFLDAWVRHNVVHALESCPKVLQQWRDTQKNAIYPWDSILVTYVSGALADLADEDKISILRGNVQDTAQKNIFDNIASNSQGKWGLLSPAWSGAPGSALRDEALGKGWTTRALIGQVGKFIGSPGAEKWGPSIPYAQSIAVIHRGAVTQWLATQTKREPPVLLKKRGAAWIDPQDMALAQSMLRHHPKFLYELTPHPDAAPISDDVRERMDALVSAHEALGLVSALQQAIVDGTIPGENPETPLPLPDLG